MKHKHLSLFVLLLTSLFFWGCTPEETTVLIKASELQKVANGGLGVAQIEMVFDIASDNDPSLPEKIKKIALPFLGKDGKIFIEKTESHRISDDGFSRKSAPDISLENAKIVGQFFIPIGTKQALSNLPETLMCLTYNPQSKTIHLVPGEAVSDLNRALRKIDAMIEFEYTGGAGDGLTGQGTTIKILNDAAIDIGVIAAKVNDKMILSKTYHTANGTLRISYNNNIYTTLAPCFTLGPVPAISTPTLKTEIDDLNF